MFYSFSSNVRLRKTLYEKTDTVLNQEKQITILQEKIKNLESPPNGVKDHGWLSVKGSQLVNSRGEDIQLRGMSSHGLMWYPEYTNYRAIETTKKYGANVFRIAMYSDENKGYVYNQTDTKRMLFMALENVLGADMYAIVDWHTLKDSNPNTHRDKAAAFFDELSKKYSDEPGVIYEICNEPNGDTTWQDIKEYADFIIPIIRNNSPNAIVLVGTPNYCVDIKSAMKSPLNYNNIMYTYHLYTGTSKGGYEYVLTDALENNFPVFVSEWGLNRDRENGKINYEKATKFLEFLNEKRISWVNWSLANKDEVYSVIDSNNEKLSGWEKKDLSETGSFIFDALKH
ncbi:hypothetical protein GCM10008905_21020 [Clostridium malenominatum]|uniref:cellulase n=1 Tax=Clostridium malenominatum TaxID=1539 RepID=A0ABN1J0Z3_9CLOT